MNLDPASIRPTLRARDLVFIRLPACRFAFGVTSDPQAQSETEGIRGSLAYQLIHEADSVEEARRVRDEVERYFLRHYPGRTLPEMQGIPALGAAKTSVFILCYPPAS
jgi:hypothetical protein